MSLLQGECKYTNFFLSWSDRGKKLFFVVFFRTPGRVLEFCPRLSGGEKTPPRGGAAELVVG